MNIFLGNRIVLEWLNANSSATPPTNPTWNHVFKLARDCLKMEVQSLEKDQHKTLSSYMLAAQDRRKKECVGLIKVVLAKANSGTLNLKSSMLVNHLLEVFQSDFLREHFLVDYTSILERYIIGIKSVMRDVKPADSIKFVGVYVDMYKAMKSGDNFGLPLQILNGLAIQSSSLASLNAKLLFSFYCDAIKKCRELSSSQQSALLSACYSFCSLAATDCRLQLCHLGEEVIGALLSLLDNSCLKQLKSNIVRFINLQMSCHHPGGATTEDEGMMVVDVECWRRSLHRLYGILVQDIQHSASATSSSKTRFLEPFSSNGNVTADVMELLVDVSRQEFAAQTYQGVEEDGGATKKRRLDRGLDSVVDRLQSLDVDSDVSQHWLQFLNSLLRKYPDSIATREQFVRILQVLYQFQLDCKRYSNMSSVLECLATCSNSSSARSEVSEGALSTDPLLRPYWNKVYNAAIRTVTVNQCVQEAHSVIQSLIKQEIVTAGPELQGIFVPGVALSSPHAIHTLAVVLRHGDIVRFSGKMVVSRRGDVVLTDPILDTRFQLLHWLLPDASSESGTVDPRASFDGYTVNLIGEILACLALRDCSVINAFYFKSTTSEITDLESFYLRSSFCDVISEPSLKDNVEGGNLSGKRFVLSTVKDKILEYLVRDCASLLDPLLSPQSDNVAVVSFKCCLVVRILGSTIWHNILMVSDLARGPLCDILQRLMLKLSKDVRTLCEQDNSPAKEQIMLAMVSWLYRLTTWEGNIEHCRVMSQFCREMFSDRLVATLVDLTYNGLLHPITGIINAGTATNTYDPDFDDIDCERTAETYCLPDKSPAAGELNELRVKALGTLSGLCRYSRAPLLSPMRPPAASRATAESHHSVQSLLLEPLSRQTFRMDAPENAPLIFAILHLLSEPFQQLNESHIQTIVSVLRRLCKTYFKNAAHSNDLMNIIVRLLPKLETASAEDRSAVLHISDGFWTTFLMGEASPLVAFGITRVLVALSHCDPLVYIVPPNSKCQNVEDVFTPTLLLRFLKSSKHQFSVCCYAAENVNVLASHCDAATAGVTTKPILKQEKILQQVLAIIEDTAVATDGYLAKQDAQCNWTAVSLLALARLASSFPACLKPVLFAMIRHSRKMPMSRSNVRRAILRVMSSTSHLTLSSFMAVHIPFIVNQCIEKKFGLGDFLWESFGEKKDVFIQRHYQAIVPSAFVAQDVATRDLVCEVLGRSWKELVEECFPQIMTFVLPGFAAQDSGTIYEITDSAKCLAIECHRMLEEELSAATVNSLLCSELDRLVVCLLGCLYEGGGGEGDVEGAEMPTPNPPHYSRKMIHATLQHIVRVCDERDITLVLLLCRSRDAIQLILLALHARMQSSVEQHEILRSLSMYELFVGLVLEELDAGLSGIWPFFLQDTIHTLTHQISLWRTRALTLSIIRGCKLMHCVVVKVMEAGAQSELYKLLITIVDCLVPVAGDRAKNGVAASQALTTLHYVVVEKGENFKGALALVDPFPNADEFADLRREHFKLKFGGNDHPNLKEEIQLFLKRLELPQSLQRTDGLERLKEALAKKKELLQLVTEEVDGMKGNLLYDVVTALFRVCVNYPPSKSDIVDHAVLCLGEIGPITFPTAAFCHSQVTPLSNILMAFEGDVVSQRYVVVFHKLYDCLMGPDVDLKRTAGEVLKRIMRTKAGRNFLASYRNKKISHLFHYINPFDRPDTKNRQSSVISESATTIVDLLSMLENVDYKTWLCGAVVILIDANVSCCEVTQLLKPICNVHVEFCELLLPHLVHAILLADLKQVCRPILSKWIDNIYSKFCNHLESGTSTPQSSQSSSFAKNGIFSEPRAARVLLSVLQHLRLQDRSGMARGKPLTPWDNNFWLEINYLNAAKAADHCRAHFTALMFIEIWCDSKSRKCEENESDQDSDDNRLRDDHLARRPNLAPRLRKPLIGCSANAKEARDLLLLVNQHIGDGDAIHGCQTSRLAEPAVRLGCYLREGRWDRALSAGDLALQSGTLATPDSLLQTMHKMGLNHLSGLFFDNLLGGGNDDTVELDVIREHQSMCAWKMASWSTPLSIMRDPNLLFNGCVYQSLLALREDDHSRFEHLSRRAYKLVVEQLQHGCPESMSSLREPTIRLALLNKLADSHSFTTDSIDLPNTLAKKWSDENAILRCTDDDDANVTINSLRCSLLQSLHSISRASFSRTLLRHLILQVRLCRQNGLLQWAEMYVAQLVKIPDVQLETRMLFKLEESKIFWARAEQEAAVGLLGSLINEMERSEALLASRLYGHVLGTYGNWLIETHSENATVVLERFLDKSIEILERFGCGEEGEEVYGDTLLDAYLSTARYADAQYKRVRGYVESVAHQSKREMIAQSKAAVEKLKRDKSKTNDLDSRKDLHKAQALLEAQIRIDAQEVENSLQNEQKFLLKAVGGYAHCLRRGDRHDIRVFRLASLWFANADNQKMDELIQSSTQLIESRKFLPLIYQLAARMDAVNSSQHFQVTLQQLIERVTRDHPHHALTILFALANSGKDADHRKSKKLSARGAAPIRKEQAGRVLAAQNLLKQLSSSVGDIISDMARLCDALIEFSYWPVPSDRTNFPMDIPGDKAIRKLSCLKRVVPLTLSVAVDPTCKYADVPFIHSYKSKFKSCGGNNNPKQVVCLASDGREYLQLVKGNDDLRQDAVMQQVFGIVNRLLKSNPETRHSQLSIGTYKVVPLSQQSGVLEWCQDTEPVSVYLASSKSNAHHRFNPNDWKVSMCRSKMSSVSSSPLEEKHATYINICNHFKPVFHHFFLDYFPHPPVWHERRTAYTKSVATSSIVGYILGLGDRHVSNILIDKKTAQFIHIDLGIAFEQGKTLPTPETVPFRLTRDVVDGMGVLGTEGVFRRCCEKTMALMRDSQEVIITILEVLLYDPLYQWTLSPIKVRRLQGQPDRSLMETNPSAGGDTWLDLDCQQDTMETNNANINKLAERVLMRLRDKLEGKEDGTALSVSGQVSHLINEAVDPWNLCRLFHGWQAYL